MADTIKVSIVVPVYNTPEAALRKCIESTIAQTLEEVEIILVDDGSTDKSGMICDEYAAKCDRIVMIHKKNGGLSAARNSGYRAATGEWLTFLDADDWLDPGTCEETYKLGINENTEMVIFGTVQEFEHYHNPFKYHFDDGQKFTYAECKTLQNEILDFTGNIATAWAKLIKKSLLDEYHIEHNEELRQGSEGVEFNIRLFEHLHSAVFTSKIYYHYVFNPNSISAKHDEKNHYFVIGCFEEIRRQIDNSENKEALYKLFYNRFAYVIIAAAISGYFSPANTEKYNQQKKSYKKYINNSFVSDCLQRVDVSKLDFSRKIILKLIKMHFFLPIKILAYIRYIQKHKG